MQTHFRRAAEAATAQTTPGSLADDALVTQTTLKALAGGVSDMTIWRWRKAGILPPPTSIRGRNYWRTGVVRDVLASLMAGSAEPTERGSA